MCWSGFGRFVGFPGLVLVAIAAVVGLAVRVVRARKVKRGGCKRRRAVVFDIVVFGLHAYVDYVQQEKGRNQFVEIDEYRQRQSNIGSS